VHGREDAIALARSLGEAPADAEGDA
jgi:hypothetical protein